MALIDEPSTWIKRLWKFKFKSKDNATSDIYTSILYTNEYRTYFAIFSMVTSWKCTDSAKEMNFVYIRHSILYERISVNWNNKKNLFFSLQVCNFLTDSIIVSKILILSFESYQSIEGALFWEKIPNFFSQILHY